MGAAMESRVRGLTRSNRYPLVTLMVFVFVVAVTTIISIHTPLVFNQSDGKMHEIDLPFGTPWKSVQKRTEAESEKAYVDPYTPTIPDSQSSSGWLRTWVKRLPGSAKEETFYCERYHIRSDVCHIHGPVQLVGNDSLVLNALEKKTPIAEERIRPYTRKWETSCMDKVGQISLQSKPGGADSNTSQPCEVLHKVPAVVFSTGGYTGNVYHEFNDGLIPLYITAQHLNREVVFVVVDYHDWWEIKYKKILRLLSKYEIIDIANHTKSHCFPDVTAGLYIHGELGIDVSLMPDHKSTKDFRSLLKKAYPLEANNTWEKDFPAYGSSQKAESIDVGKVPQLVIINRSGSRAIRNLKQVIELAVRVGFNVTILQPDPTTEMKKMFWLLDRCDVLVGVHGAGLTHFLFMRPGTIFIQIVPLGTEWAAKTYYGDPAIQLGLDYTEYKITIAESTLSTEYDKNDPVLVNPRAMGLQGWAVVKEIYLSRQKVDLSLPRFYKILAEAKEKCTSVRDIAATSTFRDFNNRHKGPPSGKYNGVYSSQRDTRKDGMLPDKRPTSKNRILLS